MNARRPACGGRPAPHPIYGRMGVETSGSRPPASFARRPRSPRHAAVGL